jgi:hypothetical protein
VPHLSRSDGAIHLAENSDVVMPRVEQAMVLSDQLFTRIATDGAELIVDIGDATFDIGDSHDGMLVEREFLLFKFDQDASQFAL